MKKALSLLIFLLVILSFTSCSEDEGNAKYIFLFIGDGMGINEVVLSELAGEELSFTEFEDFGNVTTYNLSSEITDSASAATAISSGVKTYSEGVGVDGKGRETETLVDVVKREGMRVGLVSSVAINHATPAAFYAHDKSRYNYYDIGLDFCESEVDFFGGAGFLDADGGEKNLYSYAKEKGYRVAFNEDGIEGERCIYVSLDTALPYRIDGEGKGTSHYLQAAVDFLYNDNGFFIMCEGGRIDGALHDNDIATAVGEINELDRSVRVALDFYKEHPNDTLIIVTADHETGGFTLGYSESEYETYPERISEQKISGRAFEKDYISRYISEDTPFEEVLRDIEAFFPLKDTTDFEKEALRHALDITKKGISSYTTEDHIRYSDKCPLSAEITRLVANKAGFDFTTYFHTATPVGIWAKGVRSDSFTGFFDNTDVFYKICEIVR